MRASVTWLGAIKNCEIFRAPTFGTVLETDCFDEVSVWGTQ